MKKHKKKNLVLSNITYNDFTIPLEPIIKKNILTQTHILNFDIFSPPFLTVFEFSGEFLSKVFFLRELYTSINFYTHTR